MYIIVHRIKSMQNGLFYLLTYLLMAVTPNAT